MFFFFFIKAISFKSASTAVENQAMRKKNPTKQRATLLLQRSAKS